MTANSLPQLEDSESYSILGIATAAASDEAAESLVSLADEARASGFRWRGFARLEDVRTFLELHSTEVVGALVAAIGGEDDTEVSEVLEMGRAIDPDLPIILLTDSQVHHNLIELWLESVEAIVAVGSEPPSAVRDRLISAVAVYREESVPPFFRALREYTHHGRYAWHTPGHLGGDALLKHPAGRALYDFYGANLFRADICSSVPEVGSVLEHEGALLSGEKEAAHLFRADRSYFVTNGTSMSNHIAIRAIVRRNDVVIVDRNCHKSILNALIMTGAIPVFLLPNRNGHGMIGPVKSSEMTRESVAQHIADNPLVPSGTQPALAVLTNSTYDGTMYNAPRAVAALGESSDVVLMDEAWISYAPFHPLFNSGWALGSTIDRAGPTVLSTTSLHKTLVALSQGSLLNLREGRRAMPHDRFNEAFLLHTSTSPQYSILASIDVAVRMMGGEAGPRLVGEAIAESIAFRADIRRVGERYRTRGDGGWWFETWEPPREIESDGQGVTQSELASDPKLWAMEPEAEWHGFADIPDDNYAQLDTTKVTVFTPGLNPSGVPGEFGIPAPLVARYLREHGVVVEKTGFYSLLFLFTIGVNAGQASTLVAELERFKRDFDEGRLVEDTMQGLFEEDSKRYQDTTLAMLAKEMHEMLSKADTSTLLESIYGSLPQPSLTPTESFERLMAGEADLVPLEQLEGRVSAVLVVVYPPGVPVIVPGERFGGVSGCAVIDYLRVFESWEQSFPGFENEVQGVVRSGESGRATYHVYCLREGADERGRE
jgi:arginine decarboxylase